MRPGTQIAVLRCLAGEPMTLRGLENALPQFGNQSLRDAICQAKRMGRLEYEGICTRGGVYVITAEGRRHLASVGQEPITIRQGRRVTVLELMPRPS